MFCFSLATDLVASDLHRDGVMLCWARLVGNYISQLGILSYSHSELNRNIFIFSLSSLQSQTSLAEFSLRTGGLRGERERDQRLAAGSVLSGEERRGEGNGLVGLKYF